MRTFKCDGAAVYPEIKFDGETIKIPNINQSYKYGMVDVGFCWASTDGKTYCLAIAFLVNRKIVKADEVAMLGALYG